MSKPDQDSSDAYSAMAGAVQTSVEELLTPFHVASKEPGSLPQMSTNEFFERFLVYADRFTDSCCREFSKILRRSSVVTEVRGTPTLELAKQIRQGSFETLDRILVSYVETLKRIHLNLQGVAAGLSESSVLSEAMKGAAVGQVAGGFGDGGKVLGAVGALAAAGKEALKQGALAEAQKRLEAEARGLAFSKIVEYLQNVESLPEHLLDYGCAKCFGGKLDFARQSEAIEKVQSGVREKLKRSLEFTLDYQHIERAGIEAAEQAAAREKAMRVSRAGSQFNLGCGGFMLLLGALVLLGTMSANRSMSEEELGIPVVLGISFIGFGIYLLSSRKKKPGPPPL